ncbi:MAG: ketopantoate reductase family protein [Chloroflexota bacterium]
MTDTWKPTIAVIGAGAMGCLFGGLLSEGGLKVTLIDIWQAHVDTINRDGLRLIGYGGDRYVPITATVDPKNVKPVDVVLVQCKAAFTTEAIQNAKHIFRADTVAISFQNGLGNEEIIGDVIGMEHVLGGVTAQGSSVAAPGAVRNYSDLPSQIGEMSGGISERAKQIAAAFTAAGLQTTASANIRFDIWKKLLANIALSPTCAVANLTINQVMRHPELRETAFNALDEATIVAKAEGFEFDANETREVLMQIAGAGGTGDNKSSLCVDILNKRPSEIDMINGMIVELGKKHHIPTPVNKTLVAAVKGLESHYL